MRLTNEMTKAFMLFLDAEENDLLTKEEKLFNKTHVDMLQRYAEGKAEGVQVKNMTAGAATIAKRQQSRSAIAVLKWSMATRPEVMQSAITQQPK